MTRGSGNGNPGTVGTVLSVAMMIVAAAMFYQMNVIVPFFSDDLLCNYFDGQPISDIKTFFGALANDYLQTNGRLLTDALTKLMVTAGDGVFNVVNTLFYVAAIILLYRCIGTSNAFARPLYLVLIVISLVSLSRGVDNLLYWASGATNYLWALVPTLGFILLMKRSCRGLKGNVVLLYFTGFALSFCNEMYAFPVCAGYLTYGILRRKRVHRETTALLSGYVLGALLMAFAPGNFGRAAYYTVGLGAVSRLVKMAYSLRITYVMALLIIICRIKYCRETHHFFRLNLLWILFFGYSFVIPYFSATAGRAMFATEMFALVLGLRCIDRVVKGRHGAWILAFVLLLLFGAFQWFVIRDSRAKWNIYRQTVKTYVQQEENVVIRDDFEGSCPLIDYYTMDLNNIMMPCDKAAKLALMKYKIRGTNATAVEADSADYIKVMPRKVNEQALMHPEAFFVPANRIDGIGFYGRNDLSFFVMPYDKNVLDAINCGRFYALYRIPRTNKRVKINYLSYDVGFERAAQEYTTSTGRYLLLNRNYKHYPLLRLEKMALNKEEPSQKIELLEGEEE